MRQAENFSIIAGTGACNASCPFCVSKMTGIKALGLHPQPINWRNFEKAARLAKDYFVGSVMITGKGEPTLFPDQITSYLEHLEPYKFPLIDLQTNGINLISQKNRYESYLKKWYDLGLSWIAISIIHYIPEENHKVYNPYAKEYIDLPKLVKHLKSFGYSVRFSVTMHKGAIDTPRKVLKIIEFAKSLGVEQLTLRKIAKPTVSENDDIGKWTKKHFLSETKLYLIKAFIEKIGHRLLTTGHNAGIYDVNGQNVCLTNALTIDADPSQIRQLIFFPDGRIKFDWQYSGATLL